MLRSQNASNAIVRDIITLIEAVINQNYFKYDSQRYSQEEGLAMGAPPSTVLPEIFIQSLRHNEMYHTLTKQNILNYFKSVDDILII
jgi:hypothetical protein